MRIVLALALLINCCISGCGRGGRSSDRSFLRIEFPESGVYEITWEINEDPVFKESLEAASCGDGICSFLFQLDTMIGTQLVELGKSRNRLNHRRNLVHMKLLYLKLHKDLCHLENSKCLNESI